jgi:two-component system, OmpR family, sensor histidine kinase MtrB
MRGMGTLSRALGVAWRRSLQLRVLALTLGMSLTVILALGFVLTSQVTNRVLDVKLRAATEQIERARSTVSGIVSGEEARSLDSSLQLARNTLTSKTDPTSGAGLAGAFDAVLVVPSPRPRRPGQSTNCRIRSGNSSRPGRWPTNTRPCTPRASRARRW